MKKYLLFVLAILLLEVGCSQAKKTVNDDTKAANKNKATQTASTTTQDTKVATTQETAKPKVTTTTATTQPKTEATTQATQPEVTISSQKTAGIDLSTKSLFDEVNYARQNPKEYAKILESRISGYKGSKKTTCQEAITFLKKQPNRSAYKFSRALGQAAFDHCKDMNDKNFTGHTGSNGSNPT